METPDSKLTLSQKLRAAHVRRWHIVAMAREQTIAEHAYRVQLITEALLRAIGAFDWNSNLTLNAMEWARVHDLPEVITGDMPANAKAHLKRKSGMGHYDLMTADVDAEITELAQCVHGSEPGPNLARQIVKLADLMEATNWVQIFGLGAHARACARRLRDAVHGQTELVRGLLIAQGTPVNWDAIERVLAEVVYTEGSPL